MSPAADIQALVRRVEAGDRAAEDELARHFGRRVFAMVLGRTRDPELARDLAQDTLVALLVALREQRVQDTENLAGFVLGTAQNLISNHYRKQARRAELPAVSEDFPAPLATDAYEDRERTALLQKALRRLDVNEFEVLRMTLVEDLTPAQIAARLGLSSEVVRQRKSRALKRVAELVQRIRSH